MGKYFGTDGVRGIANQELTPELAYKIGRCGGYVLAGQIVRPNVVIGLDTRISGPMLEAALVAGYCRSAPMSPGSVSSRRRAWRI